MLNMQEAAYKAWITNYKRIYGFKTDEELEQFLKDRYQEDLSNSEKKRVRDIIRELGGIKDKDYESIPKWARRKNGRRLDEIAIEVNDCLPEYGVEEAEDVYRLLNQVSV